jgi:hypothetical protein
MAMADTPQLPALPDPALNTKAKVGSLDDLEGVADELRKVYRKTRKGEIQPLSGQRLSAILTRLADVLKASVLEDKVDEIRKLLEAAGRK